MAGATAEALHEPQPTTARDGDGSAPVSESRSESVDEGAEGPDEAEAVRDASNDVRSTPPPRMERRGEAWLLEKDASRTRARALGVHPIVVRLLEARGLTDAEAQRSWLAPRLADLRPPRDMAGFEPALDLLTKARDSRWRIGIFGDYDVDGVSTATLLSTYLEALGLEVVARVADRSAGYGFSPADAAAFADAGCHLVVTGDCGTSDVDALEVLAARGIRSIVLDHHQVPEQAPPCDAFINPHQADCRFPFKGLCSAGVAFYLCAALRSRLARSGEGRLPDPRAWLDLVALATVCDMMPLREENRILVRKGLQAFRERGRPGLAALLEAANVGEDPIDEEHLGFKLGPRINAPGRLGPAEPALRLLAARSLTEARPLAEQVEMLNARRKRHSEQTVADALAILAADPTCERRAALVVAHEGWLPGIVGIAAAGLVEHYRRPALVLAIDPRTGDARGSVRSIPGIDVRAALEVCAPLLERFGGHKEAAGVSMQAQNIPALVDAFDKAVAAQHRAAATRQDVEVTDGPLGLRHLDFELCEALRSAGPFGIGFPPPRFWGRGLTIESVRVLKERHVALGLSQDGARAEAIAFGQAWHALSVGERIDCIYVPGVDHFRGRARIRVQIQRLWRS